MKLTDVERAIRNAKRNRSIQPVLVGATAGGQNILFTQTEMESAAKSLVQRLTTATRANKGEQSEANPWI